MRHRLKLASLLCALLSATPLVLAPPVRADNPAAPIQSVSTGGVEGHCYGMLVFLAVRPAQGETASAAWVVGPFDFTECRARVAALAKTVSSPIAGGVLNSSLFGSSVLVRSTLERVYGCVRNEWVGLAKGREDIVGIYDCTPP
jgi:hypothetical protein